MYFSTLEELHFYAESAEAHDNKGNIGVLSLFPEKEEMNKIVPKTKKQNHLKKA